MGYHGAALYVKESNITLNGNVFLGNRARYNGGAVYAYESIVSINGILNCDNEDNSTSENLRYCNTCLSGFRESNIISDALLTPGMAYFYGNEAEYGGALYTTSSDVTFGGTIVVFRNNSAKSGGAIYYNAGNSDTKAHHLNFIDNRATESGGAIFVRDSFFISMDHDHKWSHNLQFLNNSATNGGAIYMYSKPNKVGGISITGISIFKANHALIGHGGAMYIPVGHGGAMYIFGGSFSLSGSALFEKNKANYGGAIYLAYSNSTLNGKIAKFEDNSAVNGGGIFSENTHLIATDTKLIFIGNVARSRGGGLYLHNDEANSVLVSANFTSNSAGKCGGAVHVSMGRNVAFKDTIVTGNSGGGLCICDGYVQFRGSTDIQRNSGKFGGGIAVISRQTTLDFKGSTNFYSNRAIFGGAIYSLHETTLIFDGFTRFELNIADRDGGALYALGTNVTLTKGLHKFRYNSAKNGGAMYLKNAAFLSFGNWVKVESSHNYASKYGGGIFHHDMTVPIQCNFIEIENLDDTEITGLPMCSVRITRSDFLEIETSVYSYNDSAGKDGSFMYGGLLDRCQLSIENLAGVYQESNGVFNLLKSDFFSVTKFDNTSLGITSAPYQLCFCWEEKVYNCSGVMQVTIHRGQKFSVSLIAMDQLQTSTLTSVTAMVSPTARLTLNQSSQTLPRHCSNVSYNLFSTEDYEELVLYPAGPCRDTGLARAVVNVTLLPCPDGFNKSNEQCVCEERLRKYANCVIDEEVFIMKKADSKSWMSALYQNETYQGLILYKNCPVQYCKTEIVTFSLDYPDIQCANNRSGMLCGACAANYSLMLGSSRCGECSNTHLALLLPFAVAGIALVVFLSILRLTVATGMINTVILYANILQANKQFFVHKNQRNILTVFIAWMNLDLGFQTCFYDGMTAYAQMWLLPCMSGS